MEVGNLIVTEARKEDVKLLRIKRVEFLEWKGWGSDETYPLAPDVQGKIRDPVKPEVHVPSKILYFQCDSFEGRYYIVEYLEDFGYSFLDGTGSQCAYEDGDLDNFGKHVVKAAQNGGLRLRDIARVEDPGLGLIFEEGAIEAAANYPIPPELYSGLGTGGRPPIQTERPSKMLKK